MIWQDEDSIYKDREKRKKYSLELSRQLELKRQSDMQLEQELQRKLLPKFSSSTEHKNINTLLAYDSAVPKYHDREYTNAYTVQASSVPRDRNRISTPNLTLSFRRNSISDNEMQELNSERRGTPNRNFYRFQITNCDQQSERLREKLQQNEWRRILDEQIREKQRLRKDNQEERSHEKIKTVHRERYALRDQYMHEPETVQYDTPLTKDSNGNGFSPTYQYGDALHRKLSVQTVDHPHLTKFDNQIAHMEPHLELVQAAKRNCDIPPPTPVSKTYHSADSALRQASSDRQHFAKRDELRDHVLEEYRQLLYDIRRERLELRKEKEQIRLEKDELLRERAALQQYRERLFSLEIKQNEIANAQQAHVRDCATTDANTKNAFHDADPPIQNRFTDESRRLSPDSEKLRKERAVSKIESQNAYALKGPSYNTHDRKQINVPKDRSLAPMTMDEFSTVAQPPRSNTIVCQVTTSPRSQVPIRKDSRCSISQLETTKCMEDSLVGESQFVPIDYCAEHPTNNRPTFQRNGDSLLNDQQSFQRRHSHQSHSHSLRLNSSTTSEQRERWNPLKPMENSESSSYQQSFIEYQTGLSMQSNERAIQSKGFYNLNVDQSAPEAVFRRRSSVGFRMPFSSSNITNSELKDSQHRRKSTNNANTVHSKKQQMFMPENSGVNISVNTADTAKDAQVIDLASSLFQVQILHTDN